MAESISLGRLTRIGILFGVLGLLACQSETDGDDPGGTGAGGNAGGSSGSGTGGGGTSAAGGAGGSGGTSGSGGSGGGVTPDAYCEPTEGWDTDWAELEAEVLRLVNQRRSEGAYCGAEPMPPVRTMTMNESLQCAARLHSLDMDARDFVAHENPDGVGALDRMQAAGYEGGKWGENIATANETAAQVMEWWMNSEGHCTNIMNGDFDLIGIGYHPGGENGHLWTQDFGAD